MGKITLNVSIYWKDPENNNGSASFARTYDTMPWPGVPAVGSTLCIQTADNDSMMLDTDDLKVDLVEFWPNGNMDIHVCANGWGEDDVEEFAIAAIAQGFTRES